MSEKIDFIIAWVDGSDPAWNRLRLRYQKMECNEFSDLWNSSDVRFRDWDNLRYWFRGVEKFAPWVNKIHFVTCGHLPKWLNINHPKLNVVFHNQYIPKKYLPTFSSHCIELNFHRIPDLSEKFVYFNDDMFIISETTSEDFFKNGLPCDAAIISPIHLIQNGIRAEINDMYIINRYFNKNDVIKKNYFKWFNPIYGKYLIRTVLMMPFKNFSGFFIHHMPTSLCKTTYSSVWDIAHAELNNTCSHRFRKTTDVNQWLFEFWQYATGLFTPRNVNVGKMFEGEKCFDEMIQCIEEQKFKMICCNDSIDYRNIEVYKKRLNKAFEKIFPDRSEFELF